MANNIYKAGIPAVTGVSTPGSLNVNSTVVNTNPAYQTNQFTSASIYSGGISPTVGVAVLHGPNSDNGTTQYGKTTKNTPQS